MYNGDMPKDAQTPVEMPPYDAMIYQICQQEGIKLGFLCTNWVRRLTKDGKVNYIVGRQVGINSSTAAQIATDKVATYDVLRSNNIPAIEHVILYEFTNHKYYTLGRNSLKYAEGYLAQHNNHIVVKPIDGQCGEDVIQVTNSKLLLSTLLKLFAKHPKLCMSPFYKFKNEHRVIILDGEVRASYTKVLADSTAWKFNLCHGARTEEIDKNKQEEVFSLAQQAAAVIGLRFCSIDIAETVDGEIMVLEVNSGVMTDTYIQQHPEKYPEVRAMYHDAVKKMFEE